MNSFSNGAICTCLIGFVFAAIAFSNDAQSAGEDPQLSIKVINVSQKPVKSKLILMSSKDEETEYVETGDDAHSKFNYKCGQGDRWKARPISLNYLESKPIPCLQSMSIVVRSKTAMINLWNHALEAERDGDYWGAVMFYSDFAQGVEHVDPKLADRARKATCVSFGKVIAAGMRPCTRYTEELALSAIAKEKLVSLQISKNLQATGSLDYQTMSTMSGKNIFDALVTPPAFGYGGAVNPFSE